MQRVAVVCLVLLLTLAGLFTCHLALARTATREEAVKQMGSGFSRDALAIFQRLALDPKDDPEKVNADLVNALNCLQRLNREDELDVFREKVIAAHAGNWRLLATAGQSLLDSPHYGYLISGVFKRGEHRGGGNMVDAQDRDRVRALTAKFPLPY